ncbi:MAG: hypothetical protein M1816_000107 [Peltula sp. TS41687]|nr:MAG: hypothetical protein M1816_000107 [Peltula sp. TS41687]
MPRLVRRAPLAERIKAYLNPLDFLLWLSEEIDSHDWDEFQRSYSTPIGLALNVVFLIARANSGKTTSRTGLDDVFGEEQGGPSTGWLGWLASFIVHLLTLFSLLNAIYTFQRRRHYRFFQASVDITPSTPSARRVRVDSSPVSSSPLRFLSHLIAATSSSSSSTAAESRAHPDPTRDVWEIAVWDPFPLCLRLFCLFSPGHVLVYWLFLPTRPQDPRPSTTVLTTIVLGALLSCQLQLLHAGFSQQIKDTALIHKEVLHEYDAKFVHPQLYPLVRDVGTQYHSPEQRRNDQPPRTPDFVHTYTPTVNVNKGFKTRPNANYARYYDPDNMTQPNGDVVHPRRQQQQPPQSYQTPPTYSYTTSHTQQTNNNNELPNNNIIPPSTTSTLRNKSSLHPHHGGGTQHQQPQQATMRQPQFFRSSTPSTTSTAVGGGDGGSLGVYSHANSPLVKNRDKKKMMPYSSYGGGGRSTSPVKRETPGSPLKRSSVVPTTSSRAGGGGFDSGGDGGGRGWENGTGVRRDTTTSTGYY